MIRTAGLFAINEDGSLCLNRKTPSKGYVTLSYEPADEAAEIDGDALVLPEELFDKVAREYIGLVP